MQANMIYTFTGVSIDFTLFMTPDYIDNPENLIPTNIEVLYGMNETSFVRGATIKIDNASNSYKYTEFPSPVSATFIRLVINRNKGGGRVYVGGIYFTGYPKNNIQPYKSFEQVICPYTNIMIVNVEYLRNNLTVQNFLKKIDDSNCIYSNRWGDLPIWGLILSTLVHEKHYCWSTVISYQHNSHNKQIN
jgi:hypothetical protein